MNEREAAVHFYEMLTGVFNDDQSKIIRYVCFAVLFAGMLWAGFNYFRASVLADTNTPIDEDLFQDTIMPGNEAAIQRIVDLAQTVDTMRRGGDTIAATLDGIHNMPFNADPEARELDPFSLNSDAPPAVPAQEAPKAGPVTVKMIMTADDGQKIAVVDAGGEKAAVLRRGDEIPGGGGFITAIRPNGITVIFNKQVLKYEVPEIPKYDKINGTKKKTK